MASILTFTLNPSIDLFSEVAAVRPIRKMRTQKDRADPGGGGINVARVVTMLGGEAEAVFLGGGPTGDWLDRLLEEEGVPRRMLPIAGQTRVSFSVNEKSSGYDYRFVRGGPDISTDEILPCIDIAAAHKGGYIVGSGSLPASAPPDFFTQLARKAAENGSRFVLDTSGEALKSTLSEGGVYLVKPSMGELEELVGPELDDKAAAEAALSIVKRGQAEMVAVSMGAQGALLATCEGTIRRPTPRVKERSAIGAGDSFLGAMVWALSEGWATEDAFELGIAAGAAAVITPGTQLCRRADVEALYPKLTDA
ncbi:MAG: 1-phosphofructokinase family hexose kinase [Mesorhizobium sp.]|nr:1-phosphofructokinase family hexose kinase [Mesorhizobium sp.]